MGKITTEGFATRRVAPDRMVLTLCFFQRSGDIGHTVSDAHAQCERFLAALRDGELEPIARRMYNVFEEVDDRRLRIVREIKSVLLDAGALGAIMTGTGSAVFGVFRPDADCSAAVAPLRAGYGFCREARGVDRLL